MSALLAGTAALVAVAVGVLLAVPAARAATGGRQPRAGFAAAALAALPEFVPEWGAQLAAAVTYLERAPLAVLGPVAGLRLLGLLSAVPHHGTARRSWAPHHLDPTAGTPTHLGDASPRPHS